MSSGCWPGWRRGHRADDAVRTGEITRHADLIARVLLQHHATERELLWPALFRSLPDPEAARDVVATWTSRTALLDHTLRDLSTVARQWAVAKTVPARDAFVRACTGVADAVEDATRAEEQHLLPLLSEYLPDGDWAGVTRAATTTLSGREQMLGAGPRARGRLRPRPRPPAGRPLPRRPHRVAVVGARNFRAAVVRLRGAPPAA